MLYNDLIGISLYLGFIIAIGLPVILLKAHGNLPFEITRKLYHIVITLSILPLRMLQNLQPKTKRPGDIQVEDVAYAHRLKNSGVDCELVVIPGAFHGFDFFGPQLKIVEDFRKSQIAALKKHLFPK